MRRLSTICLAMTWVVAGMPHALAGHPPAIPVRATLESITVSDPSLGKEVLLQIDGEYTFQTIHTPEGALYIDLVGVKLGHVSPSEHWANGLLAGYQLMEFVGTNGEPGVRVEVQTRGREPLIPERVGSGLRILLGQSAPVPGTTTLPAKVAGPAPASAAERPASVSDILITPGSAGEVTIDVATTKSATFHVYRFDGPERLVMDVEGMRNAVPRRLIPVSSSVVKDVRVGQFREKDPEVVRVVADLTGNPLLDAHAYAGGVHIEVKPRPAAVPRAVAPAPASTGEPAAKRDAGKPVQQAAVVAAHQAPVQAAHPPVSALPKRPTEVIPKTTSVAVSLPANTEKTLKPDHSSALPGLEGSREAVAAPRQTPRPSTPEVLKADTAAKILSLETASHLPAYQGTAAPGSEPPGDDKTSYTGELISLNLKDVDLKDFFRLIHEISGLNILVDPNVTGSVTAVLDNVPWDQALDIVLKNNGLGKILQGNVLRIAKLETLMAEDETANKMAAARLEAAPLISVFRPVNYAKASALATLLRTWSSGGALSRRGSVMVDDRTNTLIISDVAAQLPIIEGVLAKLDTKTKQVSIEARIVLANSTFQRTLSAALVGGATNPSGSTLGAVQTGTGASVAPSTATSTSTSTTTGPSFTIPQNPATGFGVVAITNWSQRYMIDAAISAAEIRSQAKTISRPSIVTQNNVEGMVQQGTQIPVQTSINNTIAVQYVDATLKLSVTPQVTDDGHVFLKINVQNASPGTIVTNAAVSINLQQANTSVLVPDGGTVVFGGVTVTQRTNSVTQIPLLGNIPILGYLFKSTNVQDSDQELLFFVSPRLLTT